MARNQDQSRRLREQARDTILAAAMEVFGEKGFAGATTAEVATKARASKGLIFNYFPTKEALLEALIVKALGEALDHWDAERWQGSPEAQLKRVLDAAIAQVCERPNFHRLYFSLVLQPGGSAAVEAAISRLKPRIEHYYARTTQLMAALGSGDAAADAKLFQFAVNGLCHAIAATPGVIGRPEILPVEALKARLLARFLSPPSR